MMNEINKQNDIFISTVLNGEMDPLELNAHDITAQNQNAIDSIVEKSEKLSDVSDTIQNQVTQNQTIAKRISDIVNKFTIN
mgnify:CR=1 FL=1